MYYSVVNGGWSAWVIEPCSKTCGGGTLNFTRQCNNPTPSHNGTSCEGKGYFVHPAKCNNFCCPGKLKPKLMNMDMFLCILLMKNCLITINLNTGQWCWQGII